MGKMMIPKGIGVNIRMKRVRCGITQNDVSRIIGTHQTIVSGIEHGRVNPTEEEMRAIKVFLKMSEEAIWGYLAAM